jgi:protein-S-isoprenylcysteine O-methyltransferase Ste14
LRYLVLSYLVVYFAVAFVGRSYLVWRRTGVNPYALGKTDSAHDFIGQLFRLTIGLVVIVVAIYALFPTLYVYLTPIPWLEHPVLVLIGFGLLVLSLIWIALAQAQMGNAWRIGIDAAHRTELVQEGMFRLSRNPIFLGMRINLLGLFLVIPNAVTLLIWVLGDVLIQIQVRLEEEFLARQHGNRYQVYRQRIRRWL